MNEHAREIEACSSHNLFGNVRIQDDLLVERDHRLAVDLLVIADLAGVITGDLREGKDLPKIYHVIYFMTLNCVNAPLALTFCP